MLSVTQAWLDAINAPSREIRGSVEIYFDGDAQPPTVLDETNIINMSLHEEDSATSSNPLGSVSANEFKISLDNASRNFTASNSTGIYYGKLTPGVLVKPFISLNVNGSFVPVPLGEFRTTDWKAPSSSIVASVSCYDKMYTFGEVLVEGITVVRQTTLAELFEIVFKAVGLEATEYYIDPSLNQVINDTWVPRDKFRNVAQKLALAGPARVYFGRDGKLKVKKLQLAGTPVTTIDASDQIKTTSAPVIYRNAYSVVTTKKYRPAMGASEKILQLDDVEVPPGSLVLDNILFSKGPVALVNSIRIIGSSNISFSLLHTDAWKVSIEVMNSGAVTETISIEGFGKVMEPYATEHTVENSAIKAIIGHRAFSMDSIYLQDQSAVDAYNQTLLGILSNPQSKVEFSIRGNPAIELGDVISATSTPNKFSTSNVLVTKSVLKYAGGLSGTIEGYVF